MRLTRVAALWMLSVTAGILAAKEESLSLFHERVVTIDVPEDFKFSSHHDKRGLVSSSLTSTDQKVKLLLIFSPDASQRMLHEDLRREFLSKRFVKLLEVSSEKAMDFKNLGSPLGPGTYCVFTDASLIGKNSMPPGHFLHSTVGIRAWPGCFFEFQLLSNDLTSPQYQAALKVLRESIIEKAIVPTL